MNELAKVELRPAFVWYCDECGYENFDNGLIAEMSDAEKEELKEDGDIPEGQDGEWVMMPNTVTCKECGTEYESVHYSEAAEEDEDDEPDFENN